METRVTKALVFACCLSYAAASVVSAAGQGHGERGGGHAGGSSSAGGGSHRGRISGSGSRLSPSRVPASAPPFIARLNPASGLPCRRITPLVGTLFGAGAFALLDSFWWPGSSARDQPEEPFAVPYAAPVGAGTILSRGTFPEASSIQPPDASWMPPSSPSSANGTLQLEVQPPSAQVYVDGFYVGSVEAVNGSGGRTLTAGWHRLELRAPGYQTPAVNVTIEADRTITYRLVLRPNP